MAYHIDFAGTNVVLLPPEGMEDEVQEMRVMKLDGPKFVSCWRFSETELAEIAESGVVYLALWTDGVPPSFIGSKTAMEELLSTP